MKKQTMYQGGALDKQPLLQRGFGLPAAEELRLHALSLEGAARTTYFGRVPKDDLSAMLVSIAQELRELANELEIKQ